VYCSIILQRCKHKFGWQISKDALPLLRLTLGLLPVCWQLLAAPCRQQAIPRRLKRKLLLLQLARIACCHAAAAAGDDAAALAVTRCCVAAARRIMLLLLLL
jgi:hypothetical protein